MTNQSEADYYAARLAAELEAMAQATNDEAREAHRLLAEAYRKCLADCGSSATPDALQPPPAIGNDSPGAPRTA